MITELKHINTELVRSKMPGMPESKKDFVHKLGIAQKECAESIFWLELLHRSNYLEENDFISINTDTIELLKIIRSSIITAKKNL